MCLNTTCFLSSGGGYHYAEAQGRCSQLVCLSHVSHVKLFICTGNTIATGGNSANGAGNNVYTGGNGINSYGYYGGGDNAVLTGGNSANGYGNNIGTGGNQINAGEMKQ